VTITSPIHINIFADGLQSQHQHIPINAHLYPGRARPAAIAGFVGPGISPRTIALSCEASDALDTECHLIELGAMTVPSHLGHPGCPPAQQGGAAFHALIQTPRPSHLPPPPRRATPSPAWLPQA
jgi:hypothetical protein